MGNWDEGFVTSAICFNYKVFECFFLLQNRLPMDFKMRPKMWAVVLYNISNFSQDALKRRWIVSFPKKMKSKSLFATMVVKNAQHISLFCCLFRKGDVKIIDWLPLTSVRYECELNFRFQHVAKSDLFDSVVCNPRCQKFIILFQSKLHDRQMSSEKIAFVD